MCDGEGGGGGGVLLDETLYEAYEFKQMTSREDFLIRDKLDKIDEIKSGKCFNIFQIKKIQTFFKTTNFHEKCIAIAIYVAFD